MAATPKLSIESCKISTSRQRRELGRLYRCLGFLEPEPHAHLSKEARRACKMLRHPPSIACSLVELAEAKTAMSEKRAHAELQGQSRGVSVVGFRRHHVRAVAI